MRSRPRISVVIPTFQRRDLVCRAVNSLMRQDFDRGFEVIVAVDGSTDGTAEALRALEARHPLTVIEQNNAGAAAARNAGAAQAAGEIILFLDDDMEADPRMLAEHDASHRAGADAVLGHMPLHPEAPRTALAEGVEQWSHERLARLTAPGAELGLHDLLTGQLSVRAELFGEIGGFDTAFTQDGAFGNEDVDFGHRLMAAGRDIRFNPKAVSAQYYAVTPAQHLKQWRDAGRADVLFARKHPDEAMSLFRLNGLESRFARLVARPLSGLPLWGLVTAPFRVVALSAGKSPGRLSQSLFFKARALAYWRGVAEAGGIPNRKSLRILAWHALSDLPPGPLRQYGLPLQQLQAQLMGLAQNGWRIVSPNEAAAFFEGRSGLPRKAVLLTFDDCYEDLLAAGPVLAHAGGAIAFAVSGQVGGSNAWDAKFGAPPLKLLDAEGLKQLAEYGIEVGAHSRTHRILPDLPDDDVTAEIEGSVADLQGLGLKRPRFLAYPYGEHDPRCEETAKAAGMVAAFSITPGAFDGKKRPHAIRRVEVLRSDTPFRLRLKLALARPLGIGVLIKRHLRL